MQASTLSVRPNSALNTRDAQKMRRRNATRDAVRVAYETLENRQLFAAVAWTGAGDGVNWSDPSNWSTNAMPAASAMITSDRCSCTQVPRACMRMVPVLELCSPAHACHRHPDHFDVPHDCCALSRHVMTASGALERFAGFQMLVGLLNLIAALRAGDGDRAVAH